MKITVSYINSLSDPRFTILKLNSCDNVDAIHMDLMDGKYVENKNFEIDELIPLMDGVTKPIDVHLMTLEPEKYIDTLLRMNTNIIFFHPFVSCEPFTLIKKIKENHKKAGIVINPDESYKDLEKYIPYVDAVLVMSVTPGKGGQRFLRESLVNYELMREEKNKYLFEVYVDGGINDENIKAVKDADGVVVGSYICLSDDYAKKVDELKTVLMNS